MLLLFWQIIDLRQYNMRLIFGLISLILSGVLQANSMDTVLPHGTKLIDRLEWFTVIEPSVYSSFDGDEQLKTGQYQLPSIVWLEFALHGDLIKAQVIRNPSILHPNFNVESVDNQTKTWNRIGDATLIRHCYYSGRIEGDSNSLVAISICHGVRGYINFHNTEFFIEPLKETNHSFPHLLYRLQKLQRTPLLKRSQPTCITNKDDSERGPTTHYEDHAGSNTRKKRTSANQNGKRYTIEVLLVVDRFMVDFHQNTSLKEYVLTMMNMAAEAFHDRSLGKKVDITVAKLIILKDDQKSLKINHHGDKTLRSFCEWQYSNSWYGGHGNKHVLKYDIALLLTRKDVCVDRNIPCGTIGMAYIGGACRGKRKCAVIEDIGLNTAFTIAHEIGHLLGMTHDEIDNECNSQSGGIPHMMSSQWPDAAYMGAMKWSQCSQLQLESFLRSKKSFCIKGENAVAGNKRKALYHERVLPGSMYNADEQCVLQFGSLAKHCKIFKISQKNTQLCKHLWCEIDGEDECVSNLDPAAQGTGCALGKWCMFGNCIDNSTIPRHVDGGWGEWGNWTGCSRSCGIGVSILGRKCDSPSPLNGGRYCVGNAKKYHTCNTEPCPGPSNADFRFEQCEMFNNDTFKWIPVHSDAKPCALFCRPAIHGIHLSVQFSPQVVHGTKCWRGSTDICVEGKCEKIGCDNKLNSKIERDICGVCGGNTSSCNLVEGTFTQKKGEGYVTAVVIPQEAKNIVVKEEKPCASYLALKSEYGSFHINGNWKIELPGEYNVDGTIVYYRRSGTQETFYATGPAKVPLHIMVLFQDFNFGVKFQYVMPFNNTEAESKAKLITVEDDSFGWMRRAWTKCSVVCGGGIMERQLECIQVSSSNVTAVDSNFCSGAKPPPRQEKSCNEHKCPITYAVTEWGPCSRTCGLGRQKRTSRCVEQNKDGSWFVQAQEQCKGKPVLVRTCVRRSCFLQWEVSKWTKCSGICERRGVRYRTCGCPVIDACDVKVKPRVMEACLSPNCSYDWTAKDWPNCNISCGESLLYRNITCKEQYSNAEVDNNKCDNSTRLKSQLLCVSPIKCNVTTTSTPTSISKMLPKTRQATTSTNLPLTIAARQLTSIPTTTSGNLPTTIATTQPTSISTTSSTTLPEIITTTQPASIPTTASTTLPVTITTTQPTSITTTASTTLPVTITTTQPTSIPTTTSGNLPTTIATTQPTSISTTASTTLAATITTTQPASVPTTTSGNLPTTIATTEPTSIPTSISTALPVIIATTLPTSDSTTSHTTLPVTSPTTAVEAGNISTLMQSNFTKSIINVKIKTPSRETNQSTDYVNIKTKEYFATNEKSSTVHPTSPVPCLKNQLRPWACRILADSKYCLEENNRIRCCLSCKPFVRPISSIP